MGFLDKIIGTKTWDQIPSEFVNRLKETIGRDGWLLLQRLTKEHNLLKQEFFKDASKLSEDVDTSLVHFALFLNSAGNHLGMASKIDDAEKFFQLSLKIWPDEELNVAYRCMAFIDCENGNYVKAKREAEVALGAIENEQDKEMLKEVVDKCTRRLKFLEELLKSAEDLAKNDPASATKQYSLGCQYQSLERHEEAKECFLKSIKVKPNATFYAGLGLSCGKLGETEKAFEALGKAVELDPENTKAHTYLGFLYLTAGNTIKAMEQYSILRKLDKEQSYFLMKEINYYL